MYSGATKQVAAKNVREGDQVHYGNAVVHVTGVESNGRTHKIIGVVVHEKTPNIGVGKTTSHRARPTTYFDVVRRPGKA